MINLHHSDIVQRIHYCPWCGTKLPEGLKDQYFEILEKEYHIDDVGRAEDEGRLLEDFQSNVWWKKRGLSIVTIGHLPLYFFVLFL